MSAYIKENQNNSLNSKLNDLRAQVHFKNNLLSISQFDKYHRNANQYASSLTHPSITF